MEKAAHSFKMLRVFQVQELLILEEAAVVVEAEILLLNQLFTKVGMVAQV